MCLIPEFILDENKENVDLFFFIQNFTTKLYGTVNHFKVGHCASSKY